MTLKILMNHSKTGGVGWRGSLLDRSLHAQFNQNSLIVRLYSGDALLVSRVKKEK